jgi:cephalosporin-C deacetylase
MPLLDMPLEKLKNYQGRNPRPADFDEYWDNAVAEMKAADPQVSLTPAEFQVPSADCFDLYFTGVNNARVYAKCIKPKNIAGKIPAVIMFHGYTGNSGDWHSKIAWAAAGFAVFALDCRGQAGKSEDVGGVKGNTHKGHIIRGLDDAPDKLLFRDIFLDTAQLAGIVMDMPDIDETRVGAFGGSQGGGLTLACCALEPRINRAAPVHPFLCDYKRVWEMDLAAGAYEELKTFFRFFDPRHEREDEIFERLGYIDLQYLAPRIKADILWATGLMDNICPPSTQFAAYNKMTCKKDMVIYPDFGHENLPDFLDMSYKYLIGM